MKIYKINKQNQITDGSIIYSPINIVPFLNLYEERLEKNERIIGLQDAIIKKLRERIGEKES